MDNPEKLTTLGT